MSKITVGIIGTGGMAHAHARNYSQMRGVMLCACHDVLPDRARSFAERHDFEHVAESVDELIERCDAVSIVTPDDAHAALSLKVLRAGRHLLCEKPLTTTLADARKVARAARRAAKRDGVIHMVNFSYRQSPAFDAAAKIVESGRLGEIRHVSGKYLQSWLIQSEWGHWTGPGWLWRLQTARGAGGTLGDIGVHILDFTGGVVGDIASVRCAMQTFPKIDRNGRKRTTFRGAKLDANDSAAITLEFDNGAMGVIHTTRWAAGHGNRVALSVHGTRGAVDVDLTRNWSGVLTCTGAAVRKNQWTEKPLRPVPTIYQRFIRSIRRGENDQPDVVRGAQVQSWLDACQRSHAAGGAPMSPRKWV